MHNYMDWTEESPELKSCAKNFYDNANWILTAYTVSALITGEKMDIHWKGNIFNLLIGFGFYHLVVARFYKADGANGNIINEMIKFSTALPISGYLSGLKFKSIMINLSTTLTAVLIFHLVVREYMLSDLDLGVPTTDMVEDIAQYSLILMANQLANDTIQNQNFLTSWVAKIIGVLVYHYITRVSF